MKTAVIIGVGPDEGLGSQLCQRFAKTHHVLAAGRTIATLQETVSTIKGAGGSAEAIVADATLEADVTNLFAAASGDIDLAIYNAGNNTPGKIIDMSAEYFEKSWRVCCFGGFLFAREALKRLIPGGGGVLLFTGASASMRGRAGFGAFNSAKAGLRVLAQALAKEYAKDNVHVGHVVVDGAIGGHKIKQRYPEYAEKLGEAGMISIQGIVDGFEYLYRQPANAWTFEIDVRTSQEQW